MTSRQMQNPFRWLMPQENKFFDMLKNQAENVTKGAKELRFLMHNFSRLDRAEKVRIVRRIEKIEHEGDEIAHNTIETLNRTFITPIDREDIYQATVLLDDVIDTINDSAEKLVILGVKNVDRAMIQLSDIIWKCTIEIDRGITNLKKMKNVKMHFVNVHTLENEADAIHRKAIYLLFNNQKTAIEIMKLKEIYEVLELVIDKNEDVANVIENIVVKHA